jgi:hypothetical protein
MEEFWKSYGNYILAFLSGYFAYRLNKTLDWTFEKLNISMMSSLRHFATKSIARENEIVKLASEDGSVRNELFLRAIYLFIFGAATFALFSLQL